MTEGFSKKNKLKYHGINLVLTVVFIMIIVLLNVLAGILEERNPSMKIDMTGSGAYSWSAEDTDYFKSVSKDVNVYILSDKEEARDDTLLSAYGLQYSQIAYLIEKLGEINSRIHVEYIDLDRNPTFASLPQYAEMSLERGNVIIECGEKRIEFRASDFYTYNQDRTTGKVVYSMEANQIMRGAFLQVTSDELPVMCILMGGHNELLNGQIDEFVRLMQNLPMEVNIINLMREKIPDDTSILFIPTPQTDYTSEELGKIDSFLDERKTGNASLWVSAHPSQRELPNLEAFLSEWGLSAERKVIIEEDSDRRVSQDPTTLLVSVPEDIDIEGIRGLNKVIIVQAGVVLSEKEVSGIDKVTLLKTQDTCFLVDKNGTTLLPGAYDAAVMARRPVFVNGKNYYKSVVLFGSTAMFADTYLLGGTFENAGFFNTLAADLSGSDTKEYASSEKEIQTGALDINATARIRSLLGLGLFTILIPLIIVITGIVVFVRRRHM